MYRWRFETWINQPPKHRKGNGRRRKIAQSGRHRVWGSRTRRSTRTPSRRPQSFRVWATGHCRRIVGLWPGNRNRFVRDLCQPTTCSFEHVRVPADKRTSRAHGVPRLPVYSQWIWKRQTKSNWGIPEKRHPAVSGPRGGRILLARLCGTLWAYGVYSLVHGCRVCRCVWNRRK